jgi:seryl-tRNA synthetase
MGTRVDVARGEADFAAALRESGLLVDTGVPGVMGRSDRFESIVAGIDALLSREGAEDGAEALRFAPVMPRRELERSGYLSSFPHLCGTVFGFTGDELDAATLGQLAGAHEDWSGTQTMTDLCLAPAACYPVYPTLATRGPLPPGGALVDVAGWCFRHEPSHDLARLQSFRMHEHVRVGEPDEVAAWHASWLERAPAILGRLGLDVGVAPANDPFFGRAGQILASGQREQGLKLEVVCPITSAQPGAIVSVNAHRDHFGVDFGIRTADGEPAHTACMGFGLERVTLALLRWHGPDPSCWPQEVSHALWGEGSRP